MTGNKRTAFTRKMVQTVQHVSVTIPRRVIRGRPPVVGHLYFDDQGHLVYITGDTLSISGGGRTYSWRRVYTDRSLSVKTYRGHAMVAPYVVRETRD